MGNLTRVAHREHHSGHDDRMIVRAPELIGHGGWIGIDGELSLQALRGKVVVLGFWAFSCAKCSRLLDELARLQDRFPDEVAVIGVHSPKFPYTGGHEAVVRAVARLGVPFPVLDDPELVTWQQYGVRGWPTVAVVDPRGNVAGALAGDDKGPLLHQVVQDLVDEHRRKTHLVTGPVPVHEPAEHRRRRPGALRFPSKVATDRRGRLAVADTGNDRVVVIELLGESRGRITHVLGGLRRPQGVRLYGTTLVVCDTGNDRVVSVELARRPGADVAVVPDLAGILRLRVLPNEVIATDLAQPWDVVADVDGSYVVAEAAGQRLWRIPADGSSPAVIAGDRYEGLLDGPADEAELAQPSGLARLPNGIAFVDAESSSLRLLDGRGRVGTLAGEGLFDWGKRDGRPGLARMQHPQGVAAALDGTSLFVVDTYNHALRWWLDRRLVTLPVQGPAGDPGLCEPSGLDVLPDGRLVIADSANHRIALVDPVDGRLEPLVIEAVALPDAEAELVWGEPIAAGVGEQLDVPFAVDLAPLELDLTADPPVRVEVQADPPWLLDHGPTAWAHAAPAGHLPLQGGSVGSGTLTVRVTARAATDGLVGTRRSLRRHALTVR
ncbi:MAG: redoxin domain-containing protein [Acidimicrobiales bacterium]